MKSGTVHGRRWSRAEYDRMIASGVFRPEDRIELIDGEIVTVTPQGSRHATAIQLAQEALRRVFQNGFTVRIQMPLALDESSEPEPDLAVVAGQPRDYRDRHPVTAVLIVEVSDSSLPFERDRKLRLYARNRIPEYWIVNLPESRLEIFRDPAGERYASAESLRAGDWVRPAAAPGQRVDVSELMP